ncbi:MAG: DUF4326 domain-containing protein [Elainellaceae cyanobacterium]
MVNLVVSVRDRVEGAHYVGRNRSSALGNPFKVGRHGSRSEVVALYRSWLWREVVQPGLSGQSCPAWHELLGLVARVRAGESLVLECHCAPLLCHAEVILRCVEWLVSQDVAA